MKVAVINAGSSSLKVKLFDMKTKDVSKSIKIEHIGEEGAAFKNHHEAFESIDIDFSSLDAIGHRVVHGGDKFSESVLIDVKAMDEIDKLSILAPLHNPANLEGISVAKKRAPNTQQIAVFDTAFHSTIPEDAYMYALPYEMYEKYQIRRYGFHGTSHSYVSKEAAKILGKNLSELNLITLHLGNGASACAIKNGKSVDTSMGFTPLEGLVMGTRSGDIDPAIVLYMQRKLDMSVDDVDRVLNKESGLLGICGDNDVRNIIDSSDEKAKLALDMMIRRIQKYVASYMVVLESVDAIVFTGGVGENSEYIRNRVLKSKIFTGIKSLVIKTNEELEIANECLRVLKK